MATPPRTSSPNPGRREQHTVRLIPVTSSNVQAIGYDDERKVLTIVFHSGGTYEYAHVNKKVYTDLLRLKATAGSIGSYFHAHIKGQFTYTRIK